MVDVKNDPGTLTEPTDEEARGCAHGHVGFCTACHDDRARRPRPPVVAFDGAGIEATYDRAYYTAISAGEEPADASRIGQRAITTAAAEAAFAAVTRVFGLDRVVDATGWQEVRRSLRISASVPEHKHRALAEDWRRENAARLDAEAKLAMIKQPAAGVWRWEGEDHDPESLSCPVVMSAERLRELLEPKQAPPPVSPSLREEVAGSIFWHDYQREPERTFATAPQSQRDVYLACADAAIAACVARFTGPEAVEVVCVSMAAAGVTEAFARDMLRAAAGAGGGVVGPECDTLTGGAGSLYRCTLPRDHEGDHNRGAGFTVDMLPALEAKHDAEAPRWLRDRLTSARECADAWKTRAEKAEAASCRWIEACGEHKQAQQEALARVDQAEADLATRTRERDEARAERDAARELRDRSAAIIAETCVALDVSPTSDTDLAEEVRRALRSRGAPDAVLRLVEAVRALASADLQTIGGVLEGACLTKGEAQRLRALCKLLPAAEAALAAPAEGGGGVEPVHVKPWPMRTPGGNMSTERVTEVSGVWMEEVQRRVDGLVREVAAMRKGER